MGRYDAIVARARAGGQSAPVSSWDLEDSTPVRVAAIVPGHNVTVQVRQVDPTMGALPLPLKPTN
jgi:hypothetical protein